MFNEHSSTILNPVGNAMVLPPDKKPGTGRGMDLPVVFFDDFISGGYEAASSHISNAADTSVWFNTNVEAGTGATAMVYQDVAGGVLKITTAAADDDGVNMQVNGASFIPATGKNLIFEARLTTSTIVDNWFVGLCATDVSMKTAPANYIGFTSTTHATSAADAKILCVSGATASGSTIGEVQTNSTVTDTGLLRVADTYNVVRFEVEDTGTIRFYVNGVLEATHTTNIPTALITPSLTFLNTGAVVQSAYIDYVYCAQER